MKSRRNKRISEADDLPDITPELLAELEAIWRHDDNIDQPYCDVLIKAVQGYFDAMNPYFETIKTTKADWWRGWSLMMEIVQMLYLATSDPANNQYYSIPDILRIKEIQARMNLDQDESDWLAMMDEYTTRLDKIREEIVAVQDKINLINTTKDWAVLKGLDKTTEAKPTPVSTSKPSFWSFFIPKSQRTTVVEVKTSDPLPASEEWQSMQARLLAQYNQELANKSSMYNDFAETSPKKPSYYRSEWNQVRAKIFHHQLEAARCQTKDVMLQCLRLYVLAFRIYFVIYNENPLTDTNKPHSEPIKKILDKQDMQAEHTMAKIKLIYQKFFQGMDALMKQLYCKTPDRCDFSEYLNKFNHLSSEAERSAVLAGHASEEVLQQIFSVDDSTPKQLPSRSHL